MTESSLAPLIRSMTPMIPPLMIPPLMGRDVGGDFEGGGGDVGVVEDLAVILAVRGLAVLL